MLAFSRFPFGVPAGRRIRIPPGHGDGGYGTHAARPLRLRQPVQLALGHLQRRLRTILGPRSDLRTVSGRCTTPNQVGDVSQRFRHDGLGAGWRTALNHTHFYSVPMDIESIGMVLNCEQTNNLTTIVEFHICVIIFSLSQSRKFYYVYWMLFSRWHTKINLICTLLFFAHWFFRVFC